MPIPNESDQANINKERRKSMPMNMKMPIIKVTPSSPSPDPNHPDYPEFFEDKLYLEHVSRQPAMTSTDPSPDVDSQVSFDSFTLVLDPDETEEEESEGDSGDVEMADHYRLCPER